MTRAIDNIVAGYVTLKNRTALQEMREHRQHLLQESRMHQGSWVSVEKLNSVLQHDISVIDAALDGLGEEGTGSIN
jgi:hypothetical protein